MFGRKFRDDIKKMLVVNKRSLAERLAYTEDDDEYIYTDRNVLLMEAYRAGCLPPTATATVQEDGYITIMEGENICFSFRE